MQHQPDALAIPRGNLVAAIRAFIGQSASTLWWSVFMAFELVIHGYLRPGWEIGAYLFGFGYFGLKMAAQVRAFVAALESDTPFVTMDKSGLTCSLPNRRFHPWWDVAACACDQENGRSVLRLFLRGRAAITVDIDFALAAQPKASLDKVMAACVGSIVAARDPSETGSPVRDFAVARPAPTGLARLSTRPVLYTSAAAFCAFAVIVIGALGR